MHMSHRLLGLYLWTKIAVFAAEQRLSMSQWRSTVENELDHIEELSDAGIVGGGSLQRSHGERLTCLQLFLVGCNDVRRCLVIS